jgi:hypothetical protein
MSSLKEAIAARKALEPTPVCCVEKDYHPAAMVTFYPLLAKEWALPWSRLDALAFSHEEDRERIELFFPHHHVVMVGENLQGTLEPIKTFLVRALRALPASQRVKLRPTEPFIQQLDVRLLTEEANRPTEGMTG